MHNSLKEKSVPAEEITSESPHRDYRLNELEPAPLIIWSLVFSSVKWGFQHWPYKVIVEFQQGSTFNYQGHSLHLINGSWISIILRVSLMLGRDFGAWVLKFLIWYLCPTSGNSISLHLDNIPRDSFILELHLVWFFCQNLESSLNLTSTLAHPKG